MSVVDKFDGGGRTFTNSMEFRVNTHNTTHNRSPPETDMQLATIILSSDSASDITDHCREDAIKRMKWYDGRIHADITKLLGRLTFTAYAIRAEDWTAGLNGRGGGEVWTLVIMSKGSTDSDLLMIADKVILCCLRESLALHKIPPQLHLALVPSLSKMTDLAGRLAREQDEAEAQAIVSEVADAQAQAKVEAKALRRAAWLADTRSVAKGIARQETILSKQAAKKRAVHEKLKRNRASAVLDRS